MKEKSVLLVILCCLIVVLTLADLGMFATSRLLVKNHQSQLNQIQEQINARDGRVQQFIGQLKATKTIQEVQDILSKIQ